MIHVTWRKILQPYTSVAHLGVDWKDNHGLVGRDEARITRFLTRAETMLSTEVAAIALPTNIVIPEIRGVRSGGFSDASLDIVPVKP